VSRRAITPTQDHARAITSQRRIGDPPRRQHAVEGEDKGQAVTARGSSHTLPRPLRPWGELPGFAWALAVCGRMSCGEDLSRGRAGGLRDQAGWRASQARSSRPPPPDWKGQRLSTQAGRCPIRPMRNTRPSNRPEVERLTPGSVGITGVAGRIAARSRMAMSQKGRPQ